MQFFTFSNKIGERRCSRSCSTTHCYSSNTQHQHYRRCSISHRQSELAPQIPLFVIITYFSLWGKFPPIPLLQRFVRKASADVRARVRPRKVTVPRRNTRITAGVPSPTDNRSSIACILPIIITIICRRPSS